MNAHTSRIEKGLTRSDRTAKKRQQLGVNDRTARALGRHEMPTRRLKPKSGRINVVGGVWGMVNGDGFESEDGARGRGEEGSSFEGPIGNNRWARNVVPW